MVRSRVEPSTDVGARVVRGRICEECNEGPTIDPRAYEAVCMHGFRCAAKKWKPKRMKQTTIFEYLERTAAR